MITQVPYEQKLQQQQLSRGGGGDRFFNSNGSSSSFPFPPPVPAPPLPPSASFTTAGGWGSSASAANYSSSTGEQQQHHYVPGGTWQHAAIYSGAFGNTGGYNYQQQQLEQQMQQRNDTAPIDHQIPGYIANRETFPHQQQQQSYQSNPRTSRSGSNPRQQHQQQQQHQTASGLEVHAMQRLVNSAKTRFGPSSSSFHHDPYSNNNNNSSDNNNNNFYQQGQDYFEQSNHQSKVLLAESRARREKLLNSHRSSGGVAFEEKLRNQRERLMQSGKAPTVQSVTNIDGTFRRTKTPQPSSLSATSSSSTNKFPMPSGKFSIGGAGNKKLGSSSAIPLSQAQTSMLVSGIRPSASSHLPLGATTKSALKGEAPDLKKSLAEGFGMRFQPEQIEQMHLPQSVAEAALEISRYYRSTGGGYDNSKRQNPAAPETSYIHGVGDMFHKMKSQYLQMQKMSSTTSPVPKNPKQQLFKQYHPLHDDGAGSPLRAAQRNVGLAKSTGARDSGMVAVMNGNNNSSNSVMMTTTATPLYSIAGTGAYRDSDQIISSPTRQRHQQQYGSSSNISINNHHQSGAGPVKFEPPKPSARALALRAELENLEKQWKELHDTTGTSGSSQLQQQNHQNNNTTSSPEPQGPSTRDQVLGRISAVLR